MKKLPKIGFRNSLNRRLQQSTMATVWLGILLALDGVSAVEQPAPAGALPAAGVVTTGNVASDSKAEVSFRQDGKEYLLSAGQIFEISADGKRQFVLDAYDPDFYRKNYVVREDGIYLKDDKGQLHKTQNHFREEFEGAKGFQDLLGMNRWHKTNADPRQKGQPMDYSADGCFLDVKSDPVHGGKLAVKCFAPATKKIIKASLYRGLFHFRDGDTIYFSGWYYLNGGENLGDAMTLLDFESSFIQGSSGIRLIFRNRALAYELKWLAKQQFPQPRGKETKFPLKKWVHLTGAIRLDAGSKGKVELWQDGQKLIAMAGQTLPFAGAVYDRVETGLSAVTNVPQETTLYVDDFEVDSKPLKRLEPAPTGVNSKPANADGDPVR